MLVTPFFQFRNYGQQLPHHWSTISNESAFGTDYFTRTAVEKSNILVAFDLQRAPLFYSQRHKPFLRRHEE